MPPLVFATLAATWADRGNRWARAACLASCVLIPRPIMLPLLASLLWRRGLAPAIRGYGRPCRPVRRPAGYLPDWIGSFVASGLKDVANDSNLSPSRFTGAAWLTIPGRPGWASMAVSPYL